MIACLTRQNGTPIDIDPGLGPCDDCGPACGVFPCPNANPKGPQEQIAKED
jgi:hypothetical protein